MKSRNQREGKYIGRRLRLVTSLHKGDKIVFKRQHVRSTVPSYALRYVRKCLTKDLGDNKADFSQLGIKLVHPKLILELKGLV